MVIGLSFVPEDIKSIFDNKNDDKWDIYSSLLGMSLNDLVVNQEA